MLGFLKPVDVLEDALHIGVVPTHCGWEVDELAGVEATTVGIKVVEDSLATTLV